MSHEAVRSVNYSVPVAGHPDNHQGQPYYQNRPWRLDDSRRSSNVRGALAQASPRRATGIVRSLICAVVLIGVGCGQGDSGPREDTEEEKKAQIDELLERFPKPPPDTPEQIQQKEAKVEETLPRVYELLEEARTDPTKLDEAIELSMNLVALLPSHREARVAWCKTTLASFLAKEKTDEDGRFLDAFYMGVRIRSAVLGAQNVQKLFGELSEDEVQLFREIHFHRARHEGVLSGEEAAANFNDAIRDLMSLGFSDLERLKAEPRFEDFFTNPITAPVLQAAIAQMEASAEDVPETDTSEDEASPQPE